MQETLVIEIYLVYIYPARSYHVLLKSPVSLYRIKDVRRDHYNIITFCLTGAAPSDQ